MNKGSYVCLRVRAGVYTVRVTFTAVQVNDYLY